MNNIDNRKLWNTPLGSADFGTVPCGIERRTFDTIADLKAHLQSCEACATHIAAAQMEIENARERIKAVREAGR